MKRVAAVFSLVLLSSCTQREPAQPAQGEPASSATAPQSAATANVDMVVPLEETRVRFLERAAVGRKTGADGMVQTEVESFQRGEPIFASVRAKEVPTGLVARVIWLDARGKKIGEEQKPVPQDSRLVTFRASNTAKWKPGQYTVQLWLGGDTVATRTIQIGG